MSQRINIIGGVPGPTDTVVSTDDSVHYLNETHKYRSGAALDEFSSRAENNQAFAITIAVEEQPIRISFDTDPDAAAKIGAILLPGTFLRLDSFQQFELFKWTNAVAGANAIVHIFPEYGG